MGGIGAKSPLVGPRPRGGRQPLTAPAVIPATK